MNDKDPNTLKEAIKNKQDVIKQDHDSFGEGPSSTTDGSINYTPKEIKGSTCMFELNNNTINIKGD